MNRHRSSITRLRAPHSPERGSPGRCLKLFLVSLLSALITGCNDPVEESIDPQRLVTAEAVEGQLALRVTGWVDNRAPVAYAPACALTSLNLQAWDHPAISVCKITAMTSGASSMNSLPNGAGGS